MHGDDDEVDLVLNFINVLLGLFARIDIGKVVLPCRRGETVGRDSVREKGVSDTVFFIGLNFVARLLASPLTGRDNGLSIPVFDRV